MTMKIGKRGSVTNSHEKKCHEMFDAINNGKEIYVRIEREIQVNSSGKMRMEELMSQDATHIRVSILSDEIIAYDSEMFGIEERYVRANNYRPYFVSFLVSFEDNNIEDIERLGNQWHVGKLVNKSDAGLEEGTILNGIFETSASPVSFVDGKQLLFTNKAMSKATLDKINKTYDLSLFSCASHADVQDVLNRAWNKDFPQKIDIYNIGHGNCDYIRGRKRKILYDVGYDYLDYPEKDSPKYPRATKAIRKLKPSCVILSHWDLDHFIGCAYAEQKLFKVKWIAPHLKSNNDAGAGVNAVRVANYLWILGNLYLVDRDRVVNPVAVIDCSNNVKIKVWLGSGGGTLTYRNIEGLMIEIEQDPKKAYHHVLLPGDVPYDNMPAIMGKQIDFLHVPHHCSQMNLDRLSKLPGKGAAAVISTNRYEDGRLNECGDHYGMLEGKFDEVMHTIDHTPQDDEANLSIRYDYKSNKVTVR